MKKIIDNIANWLVALNERKGKIDHDTNTFVKRGKNALIVWCIIFGTFFIFFSFQLYKSYGILWLALIPVFFFIVFIFIVLIIDSYRDKLKQRNRNSRMKLVGFNVDFNEPIFRRIYNPLIREYFLDENLTSFQDFCNVFFLDFDEHDSALYFNCTQPQLKYIIDKLKRLKKGISLKSFERSQKIYHKGNLISAETLSKKYNEFPPDHEFEQKIDLIFNFLGDI